jgi:hypothetical protein
LVGWVVHRAEATLRVLVPGFSALAEAGLLGEEFHKELLGAVAARGLVFILILIFILTLIFIWLVGWGFGWLVGWVLHCAEATLRVLVREELLGAVRQRLGF